MSYTTLHGGDIDSIERELGIKREKIIDFSANVNPFGVSERVKKKIAESLDCVSAYPDAGYEALRNEIARYTGAEIKNIVVGNGSTELIGLIIRAVKPKHALIVSPCYSEYEREIKISGGECSFFVLKEEEEFVPCIDRLISCLYNIDMLIICNPNNPTDSVFRAEDIGRLAKVCLEKKIFIMVDETYAEFVADIADISAIKAAGEFENLAVVRGTSKFFACPGLRLGYGIISSEGLKKKLDSIRDMWSVNSLTAKAGEVMFSDKEHIEKTHRLISSERTRLKGLLGEIKGIKTYNINSNLVLCKIVKEGISAEDVFEGLLKYNIIIRNCNNIHDLGDDYFRFCIMKKEQNDLLIKGLKEMF